MSLNHLERYFTEKATPYISEAGGKIGGLNYLRATTPELKHAILPVQVVKPGERLPEIKVPAGEDGRFIVRGSHWMDFQGLVDVLETKVDDEHIDWLVQDIQAHAKLPYVMAYGRYENPAYDGKIFVGIQPYLNCQRGSIVEHPNNPDHYVVSFVDPDYETGRDSAVTALYNAAEDDLQHISGSFNEVTGDINSRVRQIVELYRQVDSSGLVRPKFTFQMEFLNATEQIYIAQIRAFKEKAQAKFELEAQERLVFGITAAEGVVLPVSLSPDGFAYGDCPTFNSTWAYLKPCEPARYSMRNIFHPKSEEDKQMDSLRFQPKKLGAYLVGQSFGSQVNTSLEHGHFRMAQKADLTIFEGHGTMSGDFTRLFYPEANNPDYREVHWKLRERLTSMASFGGSVSDLITSLYQGRLMHSARIISDGKTATIEPVYSRKSRKKH